MNDELWSAHYKLQKTVRSQAERIERLEAQLEKLEQDRSAKMVERIARLEAIILSMAAGSESSEDGVGVVFPGHTHWVYPLRGSNLVEEIKADLIEARSAPSQPHDNDPVAELQAELDDPHYGGS